MNRFKKYCVIACAVVALGLTATLSFAEDAKKKGNNEIVELGWTKRCPEAKDKQPVDKKQCEIFQRISVKKTSQRVAEFAVGFPQEKGFDSNTARGVVILPLGILLDQGIEMKVDDGKPLPFKSRFCTNAGCFSYLTLKKDSLDSLRKAKATTFTFKTADGQKVNLIMGMGSFDAALKDIQ